MTALKNRVYYVRTNGNDFVAIVDASGQGRKIEEVGGNPVDLNSMYDIAHNIESIGYMTVDDMDNELGTHDSDGITEEYILGQDWEYEYTEV